MSADDGFVEAATYNAALRKIRAVRELLPLRSPVTSIVGRMVPEQAAIDAYNDGALAQQRATIRALDETR